MRFEIPEFKRCCFCVPLRYGLLVWAYLSLVPPALSTADFIKKWEIFRYYFSHIGPVELTVLICQMSIIPIHFGFNILLIVAAHKKSSSLLKIFYVSALYLVAITTVLSVTLFIKGLVTIGDVNDLWFLKFIATIFLAHLLDIGLQLYIITLVRSEILKLEQNCNFQFSNLAARAERDYYEPDTVKIEDEHAVVKEDTNNETEENQIK